MIAIKNIHPALSGALAKRGYETLTPVQNAVLDPALKEKDLLVSAQTGSGKTVAFGLAIASTLMGEEERLEKQSSPLALIIAPTRELALQVKRELEWLYEPSGAVVISCVGGMDTRTERRALENGAHIVVGTPGRLRDHIERGNFDTSTLRAVVLDEADEMLDMGFREELEYILNTTPETRRTLLFSATVPKPIAGLAKRYQNNAMRVTTKEEEKQHVDIEYQAINIAPNDRENAIINVLRYHEAQNTIIFCGTRAAVNLMKSRLTNRGFSVVALSGELSQSERSNALQSLRDGRARVCVATDVAARGIDLPGLELVIHADLPQNRDILLHRSGRTGRAGSKGVSALIVSHNLRGKAERLLNNAKINASWKKPPSIEDIAKRDHERFLSDPALVDPIRDDEKDAADKLLNAYGAQQIAAALLRMHNEQKPAAEELLDFTPPAKHDKKNRHEDFANSVWVSLSIGRNDNAEPRWIVPMLCKAGNMTNRNIGAIHIHPSETHAELSADCADKFFKLIGDGGELEKNVIVTRLHGVPDAPPRGKIDRSNRPNRKSKPQSGGGGYEGKKSQNDFKKKRKSNTDDDFKKDKPYGGKPKGQFKDKHKGEDRDKQDVSKSKSSKDHKGKSEGKFERKPDKKAPGKQQEKPKKKVSGYKSKNGFKKKPRTFKDKKKG